LTCATGGFSQPAEETIYEGNNIGINININIADIIRAIEKTGTTIAKGIKITADTARNAREQSQQEQKAAAALFRNTAAEIYENLTTLQKINPRQYSGLPINAPQIKRIAKNLKTVYAQQFISYTKKFPALKRTTKKTLIDKLSLAHYKITELQKYAAKSDKDLQTCKPFRPAARLNNICKIYDSIRKSLKLK
jgi:hypothetical protein